MSLVKETVNKMYSALASSKEMTGLSMAIQDVVKFAPTMAKVTGIVNRIPKSPEEVQATYASLSADRAMVVASSIKVFEEKDPKVRYVISFLTIPTRQSKPYNEEAVASMTLASANVYIDAGKTIWSVVGDGDTKRLVQSSEDDLEEILSARKRYLNIASSYLSTEIETGDFVSFASAIDGYPMYGSAIQFDKDGKLEVAVAGTTVTKIDPMQIITAVPFAEQIKQYNEMPDTFKQGPFDTLANTTTQDADKLLSFFKKLWGDKPTFFDKLSEMVRSNQGVTKHVWNSPAMNNTIDKHM